jgi:hypothetical protein
MVRFAIQEEIKRVGFPLFFHFDDSGSPLALNPFESDSFVLPVQLSLNSPALQPHRAFSSIACINARRSTRSSSLSSFPPLRVR